MIVMATADLANHARCVSGLLAVRRGTRSTVISLCCVVAVGLLCNQLPRAALRLTSMDKHVLNVSSLSGITDSGVCVSVC